MLTRRAAHGAALLAVVVAGVAVTVAVATPDPPVETRPAAMAAAAADAPIDELLAARSAALATGDQAAWLAPIDPAAVALRAEQQALFARLRALPLQTWTYARSGDRWVVRYQLTGDEQPSEVPVTPHARRGDDGWRLTALDQQATALWDLDGLRVVEGERSLVLGAADLDGLRAWAAAADEAVTAVDTAWGTDWARRLVLVLPEQWSEVAGLLDGRGYPGYAALATSIDPTGRAAGQRILINQVEVAGLSDRSRRALVTHEAVHVATAGLAGVPLWLSEGLADFVAFSANNVAADETVPVLASRGARR